MGGGWLRFRRKRRNFDSLLRASLLLSLVLAANAESDEEDEDDQYASKRCGKEHDDSITVILLF